MSKKLLEDPKIAALVEKESTKVVKAERKRVVDVIKEFTAENRNTEDKVVKKAVADVLKDLTTEVKNPVHL